MIILSRYTAENATDGVSDESKSQERLFNELKWCHCKFCPVTLGLLFSELPVHLLWLFFYWAALTDLADWSELFVKQKTNVLSVVTGYKQIFPVLPVLFCLWHLFLPYSNGTFLCSQMHQSFLLDSGFHGLLGKFLSTLRLYIAYFFFWHFMVSFLKFKSLLHLELCWF